MTKETLKKKNALARSVKASVRDSSVLLDSLMAVKDPEAVTIIKAQIVCQMGHVQEHVRLLAQLVNEVCGVALTVDLDETQNLLPQEEQSNGAD